MESKKKTENIPKATRNRDKWPLSINTNWLQQRSITEGPSTNLPMPWWYSLTSCDLPASDYWFAKCIKEVRKKLRWFILSMEYTDFFLCRVIGLKKGFDRIREPKRFTTITNFLIDNSFSGSSMVDSNISAKTLKANYSCEFHFYAGCNVIIQNRSHDKN